MDFDTVCMAVAAGDDIEGESLNQALLPSFVHQISK